MYVSIEYSLLFLTLIGLILNLCIFFTGFFSKNKYAVISSTRAIIMIVCSEFVITLFYLIIIFLFQSFNLSLAYTLQEEFMLIISFFLILSVIIILVLLEVNKSPFDLVEAETELVTGFHTEYGAFFFALFYLGEYFHIFFTSAILVFVLTGF